MLVKAPELPFWPIVVLLTDKAPRHCWHAWRRSGFGGSDAAKILGICPFGTKRDLYYVKKNIVDASDEESNKWQKHIGNVLEETVALMFSQVTGYPVFKIEIMFRSPDYPFMLADVDYFCILPNGSICILECKTTSPDNTGKWWHGKKPIIPLNYEAQGQHYMAVMKLNKVFFACLHGNSEDYLIIRELDRDMDCESELIYLEQDCWYNNVLADVPPPYTENGELCEESVKRRHGLADPNAAPVILTPQTSLLIPRLTELSALIKENNAVSKAMENEYKQLKSAITDEMGKSCEATCAIDGQEYYVTFNPMQKPKILKAQLDILKSVRPEVYQEYVTVAEERRFHIKPMQNQAA